MAPHPPTTAKIVARRGGGLFCVLRASNVRNSTVFSSSARFALTIHVHFQRAVICFIILSFSVLWAGPARAASPYCFEEAGAEYAISPGILWSIAMVESRFNPAALHRDTNDSYDFGVMQINSGWAPRLGRAVWRSLGDPCTNIRVGAWILSQCIHRYGYSWKAVGCYNASSEDKRERYEKKVYAVFQRYFR